jgi:hypothetical protein
MTGFILFWLGLAFVVGTIGYVVWRSWRDRPAVRLWTLGPKPPGRM